MKTNPYNPYASTGPVFPLEVSSSLNDAVNKHLLLVLLYGKSHICYFREVQGIKLMINSKTCLLEQENDPTQLRSHSPGKLVRFLVESDDHVKRSDAYAEI
ncbi:2841_t:CDS:1 [Funneliformis geosporum]|uniref:17995_t:CDS:1 n=1 Tax=Funneliformis geosporum TaxID=1117311 RepID=A0A9W4SZJ0_9GLOM|nr:2841_t:CDS:1 [Funneliformis geosporum]CAI2189258.1 17995_t:CDS:1 [Funneliformis geosporum]